MPGSAIGAGTYEAAEIPEERRMPARGSGRVPPLALESRNLGAFDLLRNRRARRGRRGCEAPTPDESEVVK